MAKKFYRGYYTASDPSFEQSAKAICLTFHASKWSDIDGRRVWFPKSQIVFENGINDAGKATMLVPEWLFRTNQVNPIMCVDVNFDDIPTYR